MISKRQIHAIVKKVTIDTWGSSIFDYTLRQQIQQMSDNIHYSLQQKEIGEISEYKISQENKLRDISPADIINIVSDVMNRNKYDFMIKNRNREIVLYRQVLHYEMRKHTKKSLADIGIMIGEKDHATVLHSNKVIQDLIDTDKHTRHTIEVIEHKINQLKNQ